MHAQGLAQPTCERKEGGTARLGLKGARSCARTQVRSRGADLRGGGALPYRASKMTRRRDADGKCAPGGRWGGEGGRQSEGEIGSMWAHCSVARGSGRCAPRKA